jgi:hypothetical protein
MYVCGVPQDSADFSKLIGVEQNLFGDLSLPAEAASAMFRTRPEIYSAVMCPKGAVAAYSSAYPLQPKWAQALIAGDIAEPDLTPGMLLKRQDSLEGSSIYIGSVVVDSKCDPLMKPILLANLFLWRVHQLREASVRRLQVVMTTVTHQGKRLADRVGAKKINDGANRKDGLDVYGRNITPGFLHRTADVMERCFGNKLVQMDLNFQPDRV